MEGDGFHPAGAGKALELIGRHVDVKAFEGESSGSDQPIQKVVIEVISAS